MSERFVEAQPAPSSRRQDLAALLALLILLLAFAVRLHWLAVPSLWLDEVGQASAASGSLAKALAGAERHHGAAPLDYLITWLVLRIAHLDFAVRLPAAMFGTLTVALLYRLGRELFDNWTGLLAALLLAVAPLHLRYSQEARFYALFACLAMASTLALTAALRRNDRRGWAAYAALLVAGLYSHYYMPILVMAQGLALLVYPGRAWRSRLRSFLAACAVAAVAFLPWFVVAVLNEGGRPSAVLPELDADFLASMLANLVGGRQVEAAPAWLPWLYGGLALLGVVVGLARAAARWSTLLLLLPLLLAPPAIILMLRQASYFFDPRQVLFLLSFLLLLVASGIRRLAGWLASLGKAPADRRLISAGVGVILLAALLVPLQDAISLVYTTPRENWRDALALVEANAGQHDAVLVARAPGLYFEYYAPDLADRIVNPETIADLEFITQNSPATWMLIMRFPGEQGRQLVTWLESVEALRLDFSDGLRLYYWIPGKTRRDLAPETLSWDRIEDPAALASLARVYQMAGWPELASRAAERAAARERVARQAAEYLLVAGNVWRSQGDSESAIAGYRLAVQRWPDFPEALIRLGEQLSKAGQFNESVQVLERAVALAPENYWAQRLLAEARWQIGQAAEAIAGFRAAVALDPSQADTYFHLGRALADTGDTAAAIDAFETYLDLAPDGPRAADIRTRLEALRGL